MPFGRPVQASINSIPPLCHSSTDRPLFKHLSCVVLKELQHAGTREVLADSVTFAHLTGFGLLWTPEQFCSRGMAGRPYRLGGRLASEGGRPKKHQAIEQVSARSSPHGYI